MFIVEMKTNLVVVLAPDLTDHFVDTNAMQFTRRLFRTYLEYCPCRCRNMVCEKLLLGKVGEIMRWGSFYAYRTTAIRITTPLIA